MNIFNEGYKAATRGKKEINNPYDSLSEKLKHDEWLEGFLIGQKEERELYFELKNSYEF